VIRSACALALLWPACVLGGAGSTPAAAPRLDWVPCWFEAPFGREARCAHFYPSAPAAGAAAAPRARLPVVVLKSDLIDRRASPLLYLPAGPGSATGLDERGISHWSNRLMLTRWPHDLVLFDVRGAGLSQPRLDCPEIVEADRAGLELPLTAADDLRRLQATARQCHDRLRKSGIDPAEYSAARQMRDVGELMELLGGKDWNLWGVSYGTRMALHVAREYPERVRSVVLDSAYPPEVNGLLAKPEQFALALERLPALCANDPECSAAHPNLGKQLARLMSRLSGKPVKLQVEKWPGLWRHRLALNDYRLLWLLFLESYAPYYHPRYPDAIAGALAGRYERMLPLAETFIDTLLDPDFSHGLYYATICPEDLDGVRRDTYLAEVRRYPAVAKHLEAEWDLHVCHHWNAGRLPERFRAQVQSEIPALFLNGANDTATLPRWAESAAAGFRNGRHYQFAGSSHAVTWENDCAMALVWEFLAEPGAAPAATCAQDAKAGGQAATGLSLAPLPRRIP
jgi:pimeloyl-ACP methyl ester carboxylesterase